MAREGVSRILSVAVVTRRGLCAGDDSTSGPPYETYGCKHEVARPIIGKLAASSWQQYIARCECDLDFVKFGSIVQGCEDLNSQLNVIVPVCLLGGLENLAGTGPGQPVTAIKVVPVPDEISQISDAKASPVPRLW
ncbi:hypothetical protein VFPPC_15511 [Pochonia chlamydosporia 170]|uniref:Uncharacterized protein n=1 Tax=Pochonia chlamydosporia 170 TaxID=1380566 RepID=A0A179FYA2_METCM|nr:hypothetical protein VFPPC_15511 [Pochonia chlamydosporia 170]OAQ69939.1 hypothetical protein VFPPC_15511 [Pochonia chlamydosporia 170]